MLQDVKSYLGRCFAMKDLDEAAYILGIKIYRDRSRRLIGLCQSAYIKKILKRYHMENSKRGSIPMKEKLRLSKSQGASTPAELKCMQNVPYVLAVGAVYYKSAKQSISPLLHLQKLSILLPMMLLRKPFGMSATPTPKWELLVDVVVGLAFDSSRGPEEVKSFSGTFIGSELTAIGAEVIVPRVLDDPQALYLIIGLGPRDAHDVYGGYTYEIFLQDMFYNLWDVKTDFTSERWKITIPKVKGKWT
ncbi:retrotransposon protein, putative, ty1-copia subclass [Tanacetum coccineum]